MTTRVDTWRTVAELVSAHLATCGLNQRQIAEVCGWENPNIITMIKKGQTKVPIAKVAVLARALKIDPPVLLELAMTEYMPDAWAVIKAILGTGVVAAPERLLLETARSAWGSQMPNLNDGRARSMLLNAFSEIARLPDMKSPRRSRTQQG